jgi:hypothetical protein
MPMGRRRTQNRPLPALVSIEGGTYYFRRGKAPRVDLGREFADAMRRYGELLGDVPLAKWNDVFDRYQREVIPHKAPRTQTDELRHLGILRAVLGPIHRALLCRQT